MLEGFLGADKLQFRPTLAHARAGYLKIDIPGDRLRHQLIKLIIVQRGPPLGDGFALG